MPIDKILTWADYADQKRGMMVIRVLSSTTDCPPTPHWLARVWEYYHEGEFAPVDLPAKPPNPPYLNAYVNHGRWLTACDCGGTIAPVEPGTGLPLRRVRRVAPGYVARIQNHD